MHTMWKGSISFGLVNIPIKMFSATEDKDIKLRTLHKECHSPIKYEKVCPNCEKEVGQDDLVKGYEYVKGKYVILDENELKELKEEHEDKSVKIIDFVKLEDIDPIYFNRSYFLGPGENGNKAYSLLREALESSKKIGVAEITIRSKQQLAVVRVYKDCLVMETVHYPDEVRNVKEVPGVPERKAIDETELKTAITLIDQLTTDFDPEKYHDDYREAVLALVQSKINKEEGTTTPTEGDKTNVVDLMSALQASIERTKDQGQKQVRVSSIEKENASEKSISSEKPKKRTTKKKKASS
ncbi:non-homologous end joining protein Ku [Sutcliffiella rhizosphaerae]|uniref:Non-homologous end joining protein Ku n=1 Tax=Sutcliffiella rhizosphaerae TaxID=2880967 RepID=A0ABN8A9J2_9BACI|nr:Ku protein [Sutcliffiella rhizosphaerae]CAG9620526.1 Non-homologous end joining protein Ku [Sutcliffiella rhizosphaerae]